MINDNGKETENEKYATPDLKRPKPRHGHKYAKYKMFLSIIMVICIKQHLNNI